MHDQQQKQKQQQRQQLISDVFIICHCWAIIWQYITLASLWHCSRD
jgi:hypothetical protein